MNLKWLWIGLGVAILIATTWYLVNVVLETQAAFQALRESLKTSSESFEGKNSALEREIIDKVEKELDSGINVDLKVEMVSELNDSTAKIISYLNWVSSELEVIGGKDEESGRIINMKETEKNYLFWLGDDPNANEDRGNGEAIVLRKRLNGFAAWGNLFCKENRLIQNGEDIFPPIAIDPGQDPDVPSHSQSRDRSWEYFTFHGKPLVADLAMLEKYKMDVNEIQFLILERIKASKL